MSNEGTGDMEREQATEVSVREAWEQAILAREEYGSSRGDDETLALSEFLWCWDALVRAEPTGPELFASWYGGGARHPRDYACPRCSGPTNRVGITKLVYVHETCECDAAPYPHLVEVLYHRACFEPEPCEVFEPYRIRGTKGHPAHDSDECARCGRYVDAHATTPAPA